MTAALRGYRLLLIWHVETVLFPLTLMIPTQVCLSAFLAIGLGFIAPSIDHTTAAYLSTGSPMIAVLVVGMVVLPQQLSQDEATGAAEYYSTLPVPSPARLAAQLTPQLLTTLPGAAVTLLVAADYYHFDLHPTPAIIPTFVAIALCGAALGNAIATVSPHPIVTSVLTNVALFFVMLFSPINFPAQRLPEWLQDLHRALPIESMANLARAGLLGGHAATRDWLVLGLWAAVAFVASASLSARRS